MIRKSDVQWWVLEAKEHPESAPAIIEELAKRLVELDAKNESLRDEVIQLQRRTPTSVDTAEVGDLRRKVATLQRLLDGKASTEPAIAFVSDQLRSGRMPLSQVKRLVREGRSVAGIQAPLVPRHLLLIRPQEELLLLTNHGRGLKIQPSDVPSLNEGTEWAIPQGHELATDERLTAATTVAKPPRFWTIVTRRGYVRQFIRVSFNRDVAQGTPVIESPFHNDEPVAIVNGDEGDLVLLTRWGKAIRFSQRTIAGQGSTALDLDPDDEVVTAFSLTSDTEVLILTAAGFAARRDTAKLAARSQPGGTTGKALIQAYDVLAVSPCEPEAQLLYLTYSGRLVFFPIAEVPLHERSRKGSRLRDFGRDPAVAVAFIPGEL
jgi:DNA gyrase/topoisomerase IV subunit A